MAERRMFAKTIIDSDAFLDMPVTARLLYYDLGMRADDDGFVNSPKKIMRTIGASQDDMNILIMRKFIIPFDNGIVVIKHWRIHNYIQRDRYHPTKYEEEKSQLSLQDNGTYSVQIEPMDTTCIQDVSRMDTEVRLGKVRLGKVRLEDCKGEDKSSPPRTKRFVKPTLEDIKAYCQERNNSVNAERFFDYYESNGWKVGKNSMKDWKAAIRTWEKNGFSNDEKPKAIPRDENDPMCEGFI